MFEMQKIALQKQLTKIINKRKISTFFQFWKGNAIFNLLINIIGGVFYFIIED